jgi:hypothetical protein
VVLHRRVRSPVAVTILLLMRKSVTGTRQK